MFYNLIKTFKNIRQSVHKEYSSDFLYKLMEENYLRIKVIGIVLFILEVISYIISYYGFKGAEYPREPLFIFIMTSVLLVPIIIEYRGKVANIEYFNLRLVLYLYVSSVMLLGLQVSMYQYGKESMYILVMVLMGLSTTISIRPKSYFYLLLLNFTLFLYYTGLLDVLESELMMLRVKVSILYIATFVINKFLIDLKLKNYDITNELIESKRHFEILSTKDSMTKLYNHDSSIKHIETSLLESDEPISICILDIDSFKLINDTYGHVVGDKVLNKISEIIKLCIRKEDIAGRYGGEEFIILVKGLKREEAYTVIERIKKDLNNVVFEEGFSVTFSAGISDNTECDTAEALIKLADLRLYSVKNNGKNSISIL